MTPQGSNQHEWTDEEIRDLIDRLARTTTQEKFGGMVLIIGEEKGLSEDSVFCRIWKICTGHKNGHWQPPKPEAVHFGPFTYGESKMVKMAKTSTTRDKAKIPDIYYMSKVLRRTMNDMEKLWNQDRIGFTGFGLSKCPAHG